MKILLVHNFYQSVSPSGEDIVFRNEYNLLKKNGIDVIAYNVYNDTLKGLSAPVLLQKVFYPKKELIELERVIFSEKPDLVHFHNIFYLISPNAYQIVKKYNIPIIQTLHNFRFFCINGLLLRKNKPCEKCIRSIPLYGFIHRCFRNSYGYSAILTFLIWTKRKILLRNVDGYITFTNFSKKIFINAGIAEEKIYIKPHFFENLGYSPEDRNYALFVGRLSPEKGIRLIVKAWQKVPDFPLKIVGSGPEEWYLKEEVKQRKLLNIEFLGLQPRRKVLDLMKSASFLIIPSLCYETFGMVIGEAYSVGKPVIGSNLGNIAEIVKHGETGLLFKPGDPDDVAEKVRWMIENKKERQRMGENAYQEYLEKYTPEKNFKMLMEIYEDVLNKRKK